MESEQDAWNGLPADVSCRGCALHLGGSEEDGQVIRFGASFWHLSCFKCAKCQTPVVAESNVLLLPDGMPVCEPCSYICFVCKQKITDHDAIVTGDEAYHSSCFNCRVCEVYIEDLVFAKTSNGIYCMSCHNERVARSRKAKKLASGSKSRREHHSSSSKPKLDLPHSSSVSSSLGASPSSKRTDRSFSDSPSTTGNTSPYTSHSSDPNQANNARPPSPVWFASSRPSPSLQQPQQHIESRDGGGIKESTASKSTLPNRSPIPFSENEIFHDPGVTPKNRSPNPSATQSLPASEGRQNSAGDVRGASNQGLGLGIGFNKEVPAGKSQETSNNAAWASSASRDSSHISSKLVSSSDRNTAGSSAIKSEHTESSLRELADFMTADFTEGDKSGEFDSKGINFSRNEPKARSLANGEVAHNDDQATSAHTSALPERSSVSKSSSKQIATKSGTFPLSSLPPDIFQSAVSVPLPASPAPIGDLGNRPNIPPSSNSATSSKSTYIPPMRFSYYDADFAALIDPSTFNAPPMPVLAMGDTELKIQSEDTSPIFNTAAESKEEAMPDTKVSNSFNGSSERLKPIDGFLQVLKDELESSNQASLDKVILNSGFVEKMITAVIQLRDSEADVRSRYTDMKTTSIHVFQNSSTIQSTLDSESTLRRAAESEVARLRVQLAENAHRLSMLAHESKKTEDMQRQSQDMQSSLIGLQMKMSRLNVEREVKIAELEELQSVLSPEKGSTVSGLSTSANKKIQTQAAPKLDRSLTKRLDKLEDRYREELSKLTLERDQLLAEISELKDSRQMVVDEETTLNARNLELADLNAKVERELEAANIELSSLKKRKAHKNNMSESGTRYSTNLSRTKYLSNGSPSMGSISALPEPPEDAKIVLNHSTSEKSSNGPTNAIKKKFQWLGATGLVSSSSSSSAIRPLISAPTGGSVIKMPVTNIPEKGLPIPLPSPPLAKENKKFQGVDVIHREHLFHAARVAGLTKCDHCGEKMWGRTELKCGVCNLFCHAKCVRDVQISCSMALGGNGGAPPPSMFGRSLTDHLHDIKEKVPPVVSKCVEAVEAHGMDYEGIYRKTGGSSQTKIITQLFERGDPNAFDLLDQDRFNDISAITSVLKNYFRALPDPLMTYRLHEEFTSASQYKEQDMKDATLMSLVNQLPQEHSETLKVLMLHLYRITRDSGQNLMNARNLGVVFGPTLMRAQDPSREFSDMAGKAMTVEWLVEHAPSIWT